MLDGDGKMIEKLIPIGFIIIIAGVICCTVEYILYGTGRFIITSYFGLLIAVLPLVVILTRKDVKK